MLILGGLARRRKTAAAVEDGDVTAAMNAFSTPPSSPRRTLYNDLIVGIKADGDWSPLDWLVLLAAADSQAGTVNLRAPTKALTAVNSPTFTTDRGYAGDGITSYLQIGERWDGAGSNQFALDSATIGSYCNLEVGGAGSMPQIGATGGSALQIQPSHGGNGLYRLNDGTGDNAGTETLRTGSRTLVRSASTTKKIFIDGTLAATKSTTSTNTGTSIGAIGRYSSSVYGPDRIAYVFSGSALSDAAVGRLTGRLLTFLTAIGAN